MAQIVLFNKPFNVLTQFRPDGERGTLAHYIDDKSLRVAGRLDYDSEGLLLLTDDGQLNQQLMHPRAKQYKTYLVQVEGTATDTALQQLRQGVLLKDGITLPALAQVIDEPEWLWPRQPPIRFRASIPTTWLQIQICEGKNRQVRRMTAAVGLPTLRLIRSQIGPFVLDGLQPGEMVCYDTQRDQAKLAQLGWMGESVAPARFSAGRGSDALSSSKASAAKGSRSKSFKPKAFESKSSGAVDSTVSESKTTPRLRNKRRSTLPIAPRGK